ncbi:MAG: tRNA 2-thiocytidine biosynthesis protein TtcA [Ruminococcus sp.]|nr:tRNA 2-thiocytidine biosynthesis protein TtcA [Ruminococcus sp.]
MQRILGYMRKAIQEYNLIQDGDRICVGVSGGKDSLVMLYGLKLLQRFINIDYTITGVTLDPGFKGVSTDYSSIEIFCRDKEIEYKIIKTQIAEIVFDVRKETNPCSLCARMRRGALHDATVALGCNKIALGHNYDDAVETFIMNLFTEGRIGCFSPMSYLERKDIHMIRPLLYAPEKDIKRAAVKNELPIVKSVCPADGHTNRQRTKDFLSQADKTYDGIKNRIFGAMQRFDLDGWGPNK